MLADLESCKSAQRTSHWGCSSATADAHEAVPEPQSSILLGREIGGNIRRPSNILLSTSCMICRRSISSLTLFEIDRNVIFKEAPYLISWSEVRLVCYRVLLILSIVVYDCLQIAFVECCCAFLRVALASRL